MSTRVFFLALFLPTLFWVRGVFASGAITINEIAWMGTVPKEGESAQAAANNEWIELYNPDSTPVSLEGWKIVAQDGMPDILLSGPIAAGSYFLLERGSDEVVSGVIADIVYSFKNNALSNDGERLFLKDAAGNTVDEVNASPGWPAGDNSTKQTMQRAGSSWVTATGTPRAINFGITQSTSQGPTVTETHPSSSNSGISAAPLPSVKAYAGEDKTVIAGAEVEFFGEAFGATNEPLENARLWWNFGDGEHKEGRAISHIFQIPGTYTVGLHISSGLSAVSDYASVKVIPNQIRIKDVVVGESGFILLENQSGYDLDIGEWILEDVEGKRFSIPAKTKIGVRAEIAFSNATTGFLKNTSDAVVLLLYPNGTIANRWEGKAIEKPKENPKLQEVPAVSTEELIKKGTDEVKPENQLAKIVSAPSSRSLVFFLASLALSILGAGIFLAVKVFLPK